MKAKKTLALIMICALAASAFVSCGNQSSTSSDSGSSSTGSSSTADESSTGDESSAPALESSVVNGETNQQTYPLTEESVTLDYWYPNAGSMAELGDFNDSYFFQWYEELTGVHINFIVPPAGSEGESFQLLFAADEMPDIVYSYPAQTTYSWISLNTSITHPTSSPGWQTMMNSDRPATPIPASCTVCGASGRAWTPNIPMPTMVWQSVRIIWTRSAWKSQLPTPNGKRS